MSPVHQLRPHLARSWRGPVTVLVVSIAIVFASLTPAAASPVPAPDDRAVEAAVEQMVDSDTLLAGPTGAQPRQSLGQVLRGVRDHRDLDAWVDAAATVLKSSGAEVAAASVSDAEPPTDAGSVADAVDAGDLTGDGVDDVIVVVRDVATSELAVEARSGNGGGVLWRRAERTGGALAVPLGADVNGDGGYDLVRYGLKVVHAEESCPTRDCPTQRYKAYFRWTVGITSGASGAPLWTRTIDGELEQTLTTSGPPAPSAPVVASAAEETRQLESKNLYVLPFFADLDGNGELEVLIEALDLTESSSTSGARAESGATVALEESSSSLTSATNTSIVRAADGALLRELAIEPANQIAVLRPVHGVTRPDADDLLVERTLHPDSASQCAAATAPKTAPVNQCVDPPEPARLTLDLLHGESLRPRWSKALDGSGEVNPVVGDLNADGIRDLYVGLVGGTWVFESILLSGNDGAELWSAPGHMTLIGADALDEAPGQDLIFAVIHTVEDGEAVELERRNGATGTKLFSTTHDFGWTGEGDFIYRYMYAGALGDGDGDGVTDIFTGIMRVISNQQPDGTYETVEVQANAVVESGATGTARHSLRTGEIAYLQRGGDVDGDGLHEILDERYQNTPGAQTSTLTPVRLGDAQPLWTAHAAGADVEWVLAGDTDGDGGRDVLRHVRTAEGPRQRTVITALRGRGGASLWEFGSP